MSNLRVLLRCLLVPLLFLQLFGSRIVLAAEVRWLPRMESHAASLDLTSFFQYASDERLELSADAVFADLGGTGSIAWKQVEPRQTSLGTRPGAIWLHTRISSGVSERESWKIVFSLARFNEFDAWVRYSDGRAEAVKAGLRLPFPEWTFPFHLPTIPLYMHMGETADVLVRLASSTPLIIRSTLYDASSFLRFQGREQAMVLSFVAVMAIAFVFGVIIFFALRQSVALVFLFQALAMTLYALSIDLFDFQYLWPSLPRFALSSKNVFGGLNFLAICLMAIFSLEVKSGWRLWILGGLTGCNVLAPLMTLFVDAPWFDAFLGFLGMVNTIMLVLVFTSLLGKHRQAKYFLLGYSLFLFFMLFHLFQVFGIIREREYMALLPYLSAGGITLVLLVGFIREIGGMNRRLSLSNVQLSELNASLTREIDERIRVANELAAERQRSIEKARVTALGEMSRNIAHEINTPLSILSFKIENIERELEGRTPDVESARTILSTMSQVVRRATMLVQSMRLLAREGKNEAPVLFDLAETLNGVTLLARERSESAGIDIRMKMESPHLRVRGRQAASFQILTNLVNNAIDAHRKSPPRGRYIELASRLEAGFLVVSVEDNGCGIPVEFENNVFEPFFTTKPGSSGMGLGLGLARNMAREDGGDVQLERPRDPTRFSWTIPLENVHRIPGHSY